MDEKTKAKELVAKFIKMEFGVLLEFVPGFLTVAKECAKIVCDECIKEHSHEAENKNPVAQDRWITFWQNVKKEIENL
jgi:hypothetical protein